jgi:hypothetical protein
MFVGLRAAYGSHCRKIERKVCRYVSSEFYVCHVKSVPEVVGVLIPTNLIFCEQSW